MRDSAGVENSSAVGACSDCPPRGRLGKCAVRTQLQNPSGGIIYDPGGIYADSIDEPPSSYQARLWRMAFTARRQQDKDQQTYRKEGFDHRFISPSDKNS